MRCTRLPRSAAAAPPDEGARPVERLRIHVPVHAVRESLAEAASIDVVRRQDRLLVVQARAGVVVVVGEDADLRSQRRRPGEKRGGQKQSGSSAAGRKGGTETVEPPAYEDVRGGAARDARVSFQVPSSTVRL